MRGSLVEAVLGVAVGLGLGVVLPVGSAPGGSAFREQAPTSRTRTARETPRQRVGTAES